MVTTLEPGKTIPVESAPAPEAQRPETGAQEWCISMPFAGVRYFAFRPAPPAPERYAARQTIPVELIPVELIGEKVIPL